MLLSELFEGNLQDTLAHLYASDFQPHGIVYRVLDCNPQNGVLSVQASLIHQIETMNPPAHIPSTAHVRRAYDVLFNRFVLGLTQEETAEQLHVSLSTARRAQLAATHLLAMRLWASFQARQSRTERGKGISPVPPREENHGMSWQSQVRQDLASLDTTIAEADVEQAIRYVVELVSGILESRGISLTAEETGSHLVAAIHLAAFRQILVMATGLFLRNAATGDVTIDAARDSEYVRLVLTGPAAVGEHQSVDCGLIREILDWYGGTLDIAQDENHLSLVITLPSVGDVLILVVDDNPDMLHFYRRCVEGTRYRICHEYHGKRVFEAVEAHTPDVIVLDIMLPDVDGWELLSQLHQHPRTESIPVIVCSVIREEELAIALGAAAYLPKPIRHQRFLQALDQVTR